MPTRIELLSTSFLGTVRQLKEYLNDKNSLGGVTIMQLGLLWFIAKAVNPTMKDIAEHLRVAPPSATAVIDGLVKAKLIKRSADPEDRRTVRLMMTPAGTKLLDRGWKLLLARMGKVLSRLSRKDQDDLALLLTRLSAAFKE